LESPGGWALQSGREQVESQAAITFLAPEIRDQVSDMIRSARRVPEEALSFKAMTRLLTAQREE
jgi:hypothetical protein